MRISKRKYDMVRLNAPIAGVELIIHKDKQVLVGRRTISPGKGKWALIGGRILKGEKMIDAVRRTALSETGLAIRIEKQVGITECFFRKYHYITIEFLVSPTDNTPIKLDFQHSEYKWVNSGECLFEIRAREIVEKCLI